MPRRKGRQLFADHREVHWDKKEGDTSEQGHPQTKSQAQGQEQVKDESAQNPDQFPPENVTHDSFPSTPDFGDYMEETDEDRSDKIISYEGVRGVLSWSARPGGRGPWTHFTSMDGRIIYRGPVPLGRRTWSQEYYMGPDPYVAFAREMEDLHQRCRETPMAPPPPPSELPPMPQVAAALTDSWSDMQDSAS